MRKSLCKFRGNNYFHGLIGMNKAFLCLGGNLGDRLDNIEKALHLLTKTAGTLVKTSKIYETGAWGSNSKKNYLNVCVQLDTILGPEALMKRCLAIESKLGRKRGKSRNIDRTMDIDVLFFNNSVIRSKELQVPHPRIELRKFVLVPLNDIAPELLHPILHKKISTLLKQCNDPLPVKVFTPLKPRIICIEGNIGSGKTTLASLLAKTLKAEFVPEKFEHNPILPLFYKDASNYALALETSFLLERFNQLHKAFANNDKTFVCDFSIYKCLWFAKANLKKTEYNHYKKIFNTLSSELPKPDLIIYLNTSPANLIANIKKRGRSYEKNISKDYLKSITENYENGLKNLKDVKNLTIHVPHYSNKTSGQLLKQVIELLR